MSGPTSHRRWLCRRWLALLSVSFLGLTAVRAQPAALPPPVTTSAVPAAPAEAVRALDLDALRAIAMEKNTAIAAARASLAAAAAGKQGVDSLRVPTCLQPDLPYRRKQAALGVVAAEAGVRNAELLAVFGVQYAYVSYLYAREQERVARRAVGNINDLAGSVRAALKNPEEKTDLGESDALLLEGLRPYTRARLLEATLGRERALSALREALGLGCDVPLLIPHERLPDVRPALTRQQVVQLALANRPELVQASINVQVTDLEVQAQKSRRGLNVRTFASGADLHAVPLPAGQYDSEYRPGAVGPEMPPFLSGRQSDRVARASALLGRAVSVNDRARGLITLEVEQAFLRYEEASGKIDPLLQAAARVTKASDDRLAKLRNSKFGEGSKAVLDDLLKLTQVASQFRVQANEARYQLLLALVTLERATGAAFRADLCHAPEVKDE